MEPLTVPTAAKPDADSIGATIDTPSADLISDLDRSPEVVVVRPLIPLNNSVPEARRLGLYSTLIMFIGRILGSGIFATPGLILRDAQGSYSLYLGFWLIGGIIAYTGLSLYLELGSYLPTSGGTKTFLEYMFPRPKYLTTVVFSIFTLLFSFSSANALVFGEYLRYSLGYDKNEQSTRWIACALIVACSLLHGVSKRVGSMAQNALGTIKLATLVLVLFTCFYILVLPESLTKIPSKFEPGRFNVPSSFQGSIYATALLKCIHSFGGWTTCHTVQNEIKDPIATLRKAGPLSIVAILILYILLNLCYLKVIPYQDFIDSDQLAGALLFSRVYGRDLGSVLINLLIAISSATNVIIVVYSDSIMNQEIFREGFLPFSKQLCTNYPFGTPVFGILVHCIASCALIYLPKNQVYNRIISVQYYPNQLFHAVLCLGLLFKLRTRFPNIHAPIRASTVTIYVCLVGSLSVVVSPFISGSYYFTLASLGTLAIGFIYWLVAFRIVPLVGRFHYVVVPRRKKDGLIYKQWIKDYDGELSPLLV